MTNSKNDALRVIFVPQFDEVPYQIQLAAELEKLGMEVHGVRVEDSSAQLPQLVPKPYPDVLHLHWLHPLILGRGRKESLRKTAAYVSHLLHLRRHGVRIIWTVHNLQNHEEQMVNLEHWCSRLTAHLAHKIIVHSEAARHEVVRKFAVRKANKVVVVPQGNYSGYYPNTIGREAARRVLNLPEDSLVFLFLGMIRRYKGVVELIEAFNQLELDNAYLVIAGNSWDEVLIKEIEELIEDKPRIHFYRGFVPDDQIQVYMNACDTTVYPFRAILTSATVMLAMSFGRACIAPRLGGIGEVLDTKGGFVYEAEEVNGLFRALRETAKQRNYLPLLGEHNIQLVKQWSWDRIAVQTAQLYSGCCGENP